MFHIKNQEGAERRMNECLTLDKQRSLTNNLLFTTARQIRAFLSCTVLVSKIARN